MKYFRISKTEVVTENTEAVNVDEVNKHVKNLLTLYDDTLNCVDIDEDLLKKIYAYCKVKEKFDEDGDFKDRIKKIKTKHLKDYLRDEKPNLEAKKIHEYISKLKDKQMFLEGIYFVAFNQYIGERDERCPGLMARSVIACALHDYVLRDIVLKESEDISRRLKALKQIYTVRQNYIPDLLDLPLHKQAILTIRDYFSVTTEQISRISEERTICDGEEHYDFIPSKFLGVFSGIIGDDCTCDEGKNNPYARAMHEDTMYYIVYKDNKPLGYIGLMEAEAGHKKVLTIDTIQRVPSFLIPDILEKLHHIALNKGFIGIALPSNARQGEDKRSPMQDTFNYPEIQEEVTNLPGYKNGEKIKATAIHSESWQEFNKVYGAHPHFAIEKGRYILYKPASSELVECTAGVLEISKVSACSSESN